MEQLANDQRSTPDLFEAALQSDDDVAWDAISALRSRGSKDVLDQAVSLTHSDSPFMRMRGADILGQLGLPEPTFPDECFQSIQPLLKDHELAVVDAAITALGYLDRERAALYIVPFQSHDDDRIRLRAAMALCGVETQTALDALMRLTEDQDDIVRDWATFGIGRQTKADTPEIRNALAARLGDHDEVVRYEATCGLALKRDRRAVSPLMGMLEANSEDFDLKEAAGTMLGEQDGSCFPTSELLGRLRRIL